MRIGIAGFMHESNTFNPILADRAAFAAQSLALGDDMLREWREARHEVGGFFAAAGECGFVAVPLLMAWATPSGPVTRDVFEEVCAALIERLRAERLDGLLLALHGAMVSQGRPDADREILARVRAAVGPDFPVGVTFDLHGNLPSDLAEVCDLAVAYRTNPHVDQYECGLRAARLLVRWVRGEIRPRLVVVKPAMRINIMKQDTSLEPLAGFMRRVAELEALPSVLGASLLPGFAYADVPHVGPAVVVVADGETREGLHRVEAIAADLFARREEFDAHLPDPATAVKMAIEETRLPVVLVDTGDNVGGGSAGDGTVLLAELLRQGATGFVISLYDPESVGRCREVGEMVRLCVGGKVDRLHGDPVAVEGVVRLLHDGTYTETQVRHGGKRLNRMGPTALVELPGDNWLALTSLRHPPFSLGALTCLGLEPKRMRILVVKAAIAYKAAYGPVAGSIVEAETPGVTAIRPR
jgi:microcystin degradation protein MlrC